jgi:hypothetical protein
MCSFFSERAIFAIYSILSIIGDSSLEQLLKHSCLVQHGMQETTSSVRVPLGHPKELPWHVLHGVLFHRRQREELGVGHSGQRTMVRGTLAAAWAALPINGAGLRIATNACAKCGSSA